MLPRRKATLCLGKFLRFSVCASKSQPEKCFLQLLTPALRRHSSQSGPQHSVAIVGSGPAGYYTAQQLLKGDPGLVVDVYEKLPVPFGLVRYGVAPDHPEVKNVIHTFTQTAQNERCNFLGNIEVGRDVSLQELRNAYSAVILCYGAAEDRTLGIPGEDLPNVISAKSFVGWYNGLPEDKDLPVNLDCESAVVLGHGNVALDVARILLTPINILEKTDISEHALDCLRRSKVKRVHLVGRRGPLQVAFTIKELREMVKLPGTRPVISPQDVQGLDKIIKDLPRPRRRLTELIHKTGTAVRPGSEEVKEWTLHFCRSPQRILTSAGGDVAGIELVVNRLQGETLENQKAVATDEREILPCGLVLRSIGYKSLPLDPSVPFSEGKNIIDNEDSRVKGEPGLYCTGWIGRGPVGVIADTMNYAFDTGRTVLQDLDNGRVARRELGCRDQLLNKLRSKAVTFEDWEKIDMAEMAAGEKIGKPREKLVNVEEMLQVACR